MKRTFIIFALLLLTVFSINVNASELEGYTNQYGVTFSQEEYDFISKFYFDGYQEYMTMDAYNSFIDSDIMNADISIKVYNNEIMPMSSIYETNMKQLKVSTACYTDCNVTTVLSWKSLPSVRSYDLIGAYFDGTSLISGVSSFMFYDSSKVSPAYSTKSADGVSSTFKLPSKASNLNFTQEFIVAKSGSINVSYQHARKSISLANSKKFSLSKNGYGGVFKFQESIRPYYDAMGGLTINLA